MTLGVAQVIVISPHRKSVLCLSLVAVVVCALVVAGARLSVFGANSAGPDAATERVVIAVEGMYCDSCAAGIKAMLKRTPGVISADVSYARKEAVVDYEREKTTPERIVEAVNNLGYKASVKNKS